jgi:SAM-dependent methyltransferase
MSAATDAVEVRQCPLCGSERFATEYDRLRDERMGVPGLWSFRRCLDCGVIYGSPRLRELSDAYPPAYAQHERPDAPSRTPRGRFAGIRGSIRERVLRAHGYGDERSTLTDRILARIPLFRRGALYGSQALPPGPPGTLLDVGCGNGRFLAIANLVGWRVEGVEPDPVSAAVASRWGPIHSSIDDPALRAETFDAITLSHSLEHMNDPLRVLQRCRALLKPEGTLVVLVPNWRSVQHRIFQRLWRPLEPSRHLIMFDRRRLSALVEEAGFTVVRAYTSSQNSARFWFADHWRLRFGKPPSRLVRSFLFPLFCELVDLLLPDGGDEIVLRATPLPRRS